MQEMQADVGLNTGVGIYPGGGHGNPLQYSCLENPMGLQRVGYDWRISTAQHSNEQPDIKCFLENSIIYNCTRKNEIGKKRN